MPIGGMLGGLLGGGQSLDNALGSITIDTSQPKAALLEAMTEAAMQGHDLGPFEPVDTVSGGYQAVCRQCGKSVRVGDNGVMYSLLEGSCPERPPDAD